MEIELSISDSSSAEHSPIIWSYDGSKVALFCVMFGAPMNWIYDFKEQTERCLTPGMKVKDFV
jgi:hypothetical protein